MPLPIQNSFPNNWHRQARGKCNDSSCALAARRKRRAGPQAPPQVVSIDPNETDPVRGMTFAQQALAGLHKHATQGPWPKTVPPGGARTIRYNLVRQASFNTRSPG